MNALESASWILCHSLIDRRRRFIILFVHLRSLTHPPLHTFFIPWRAGERKISSIIPPRTVYTRFIIYWLGGSQYTKIPHRCAADTLLLQNITRYIPLQLETR